MRFISKHWFKLLLASLAIAAAASIIFAPPMLALGLAFGIASSAAYASLGAAAGYMALATVAVCAAAAIFVVGGALKVTGNLLGWAARSLFGSTNERKVSQSLPLDDHSVVNEPTSYASIMVTPAGSPRHAADSRAASPTELPKPIAAHTESLDDEIEEALPLTAGFGQ